MTDLAAETDVDSRLRRLVDWALGDDVLAGPDVGQAVLSRRSTNGVYAVPAATGTTP
jgi:hypothetical protein